MKRGSLPRKNASPVTIWIPTTWKPLIDEQVRATDADRSKFIRCAIKEKLARQGLGAGLELAVQ